MTACYQMPRFEIVELTPTRYQVNELRLDGCTFVGIRETRHEAEESVRRLQAEYRAYFAQG